MAYIKISDPKIIDLPTIHQIVNVVNQHSDNISAITNNFGSVYSNVPVTSNNTTQGLYDISSQQIYYGYTTISDSDWDTSSYEYKKQVNFTSSFTTIPIIVASVSTLGQGSSDNSSATATALTQDLVVNIKNPQQSVFTISLRHVGDNATTKVNTSLYGAGKDGKFLAPSYTVTVNWIAIGHK